MLKIFKSSSEEYICGVNEDNSISIFKLRDKDLDPCYQINKPRERPNSASKSKCSSKSKRSILSHKPQRPLIIDCIFLDDEYLLYIDEENFAHIHFFGKNCMVSERNLKGSWSFNLFKNRDSGTESYMECLKLGGSDQPFWGVVTLSQVRTANKDTETEFFTKSRSVLRLYEMDPSNENLLISRDLFDFDQKEELNKVVLSSLFLKEEDEDSCLIGLDQSEEKIYEFEVEKEKKKLKFVSPRAVKSDEDSLYLIISGCKSARKYMSADRAVGFSEGSRNFKMASDFDLRVKLNLE